jgi:hypothetical protein
VETLSGRNVRGRTIYENSLSAEVLYRRVATQRTIAESSTSVDELTYELINYVWDFTADLYVPRSATIRGSHYVASLALQLRRVTNLYGDGAATVNAKDVLAARLDD